MYPRRCLFFLAASSLALVPSIQGAEQPTPAAKHVLYLGLDVSLELDDSINPVIGTDNTAVYIQRNDRRIRHALRHGGNFQTVVVPRVSASSLEISNVTTERAFSRGADPHRDAMVQEMMMVSAQQAAEEVAESTLRSALSAAESASVGGVQAAADAAAQGMPVSAFASGPGALQSSVDAAMTNYSKTYGTSIYSSHAAGKGLAGDDANHNAYSVAFTIKAPEQIRNVYSVLRLFVRSPEKPNELTSSIRFFTLPDLGPKPRKVVLLHENLPEGFTLDRYEIHIYTGGQELASNLSNNRVELTLDEIHQFLLLKHISDHGGRDAPVGIASELLENDLRSHVPADQVNRAVDVAIDASGRATKVTLEKTGWNGPDAYLLSVIKETRFLPAVVNGKPVAREARFVISEFFP